MESNLDTLPPPNEKFHFKPFTMGNAKNNILSNTFFLTIVCLKGCQVLMFLHQLGKQI